METQLQRIQSQLNDLDSPIHSVRRVTHAVPFPRHLPTRILPNKAGRLPDLVNRARRRARSSRPVRQVPQRPLHLHSSLNLISVLRPRPGSEATTSPQGKCKLASTPLRGGRTQTRHAPSSTLHFASCHSRPRFNSQIQANLQHERRRRATYDVEVCPRHI